MSDQLENEKTWFFLVKSTTFIHPFTFPSYKNLLCTLSFFPTLSPSSPYLSTTIVDDPLSYIAFLFLFSILLPQKKKKLLPQKYINIYWLFMLNYSLRYFQAFLSKNISIWVS